MSYQNNRDDRPQPAPGNPRYQGGQPTSGYQGNRSSSYQGNRGSSGYKGRPNTRNFNPNRKKKKQAKIFVSRALLRYERSKDIQIAFVNYCKQRVMKPELFERVMQIAKNQVDAAAKKRTAPVTTIEILKAISDDLEASGIALKKKDQ